MDGGFRVPRPADRRVTSSRSEPVQRLNDEPKTAKEVPVPAPRAVAPKHYTQPKQKSKKWLKLPIIAIIILLLSAGAWFGWSRMQATGLAIDSSKYQAVFFTNGQVYFGKLELMNSDYMKLTDIYYLQSQQGAAEGADPENPQETSANESNVQLIKLGNEVHGPEDQMVIIKDQVLFYENIKADGKVAQSIQKHKKP